MPSPAATHSAALNAEGCHTNRTTGDCHCHRSTNRAAPQQATPSAPIGAWRNCAEARRLAQLRSIADSQVTDLGSTRMATASTASHIGADEPSTPRSGRRCRCSFRIDLRVYASTRLGRRWPHLVRRGTSHPTFGTCGTRMSSFYDPGKQASMGGKRMELEALVRELRPDKRSCCSVRDRHCRQTHQRRRRSSISSPSVSSFLQMVSTWPNSPN